MNIITCIDSLVSYAMNRGLADPVDHQVLTNRLLDLENEMRLLRKGEKEETPISQSDRHFCALHSMLCRGRGGRSDVEVS